MNSTKLYSRNEISVATYFGGPLAASILIYLNYENLGQKRNGKISLIIGILSTVVFLIGIFTIPDHLLVKMPIAIIPLSYTAIVYFLIDKIQGKEMERYSHDKLDKSMIMKAMGIGAFSAIILITAVGIHNSRINTSSNTDFDQTSLMVNSKINRFMVNNEKAMDLPNLAYIEDTASVIDKLDNGLILWKENQLIVDSLLNIDNLNTSQRKEFNNLETYCALRIKENRLVKKYLIEGEAKYADQLEELNAELIRVMNELR